MNFRCLLALAATGWFSAGAAVNDDTSAENPYTPIVVRNVFGLLPIPVHNPADDAPVTPPPKITPTGIMTIFGKTQALFKVAGVAKPGQPPKDESYVMVEGERQDDIEVQKIDEPAATITFNNHGTIQALPLVAGTASNGGPAPAPAGKFSPAPAPAVAPAAGGSPTTVGFGGRFGRGARTAPGAGSPGTGGAPGFGGAPGSGFSGGSVNNNGIYSPPAVPAGDQMTAEQRIILIEAQRQKYQQEGNPIANLLPPTPLTQQAAGQGGSDGTPAQQ